MGGQRNVWHLWHKKSCEPRVLRYNISDDALQSERAMRGPQLHRFPISVLYSCQFRPCLAHGSETVTATVRNIWVILRDTSLPSGPNAVFCGSAQARCPDIWGKSRTDVNLCVPPHSVGRYLLHRLSPPGPSEIRSRYHLLLLFVVMMPRNACPFFPGMLSVS